MLSFSLSISVTLAHIHLLRFTKMQCFYVLYINLYLYLHSIYLSPISFPFAYVLCNSFVNCTKTKYDCYTGTQCKETEFFCYDRQFCINSTQHCDGFYDCKDFSDEQNCIG